MAWVCLLFEGGRADKKNLLMAFEHRGKKEEFSSGWEFIYLEGKSRLTLQWDQNYIVVVNSFNCGQ